MSQIDAFDASNPYKNKLRNAKKKVSDIEALENSGKQLDESQMQKVKGKKKAEKEVADLQASYDNWNNEQIAALQQQQAKGAPKQAPAKADKPAPKQQQAKPEAKKAEKKEESPAQQQQQKKEAVKAEKQPKEQKAAAPAKPAEPIVIDDSLNPYKNSVRNAKKKLQAIEALEGIANLDEAQAGKLKNKKKIEKELADAQANYDQWVNAQRQALEQSSKPAKAEKQAKPQQQQAAKQEQKPQAKQAKEQPKEQPKEQAKQQQPAAKPAAKKEAAPAKQAAPAKPAAAKPAASEEEVKTAKNKLRNLEKKLKQIEELKAKDKNSLSQEQKDKIASEKKTQKEFNEAEAALKKLEA